jgi:hypothetical protein
MNESTLVMDTEEKLRILNYSKDDLEAGPPEEI